MTEKRAEPFLVALAALRRGLREGEFDFERRLAATEVAEGLSLSPTPVREALARLAGEGLVEERRGQGYFVRRPGPRDVGDLYRLSLMHLAIALEPRDIDLAPDPLEVNLRDADSPVTAVERLFEALVARASGWDLVESHRRLAARLGPVRRQEARLIDDLHAEAAELAALAAGRDAQALVSAVRLFHRRRIRLAPRLAALLERRPIAPI